jgi:hypothetical protein
VCKDFSITETSVSLLVLHIIAAQHLGFKMSPPAYLSLTPLSSLDLLRGRGGANYASGGSGILDITVSQLVLVHHSSISLQTHLLDVLNNDTVSKVDSNKLNLNI